MAKNKKSPCGTAIPTGANDKLHYDFTTAIRKKASVDLRCAFCKEYQGSACKGLLEYHPNDCTLLKGGRRYGKN